jgi:hypothetical protein
VAVEDDAVVRQGVNVRRRNLVRSVETYVIPALSKGDTIALRYKKTASEFLACFVCVCVFRRCCL